MREDVRDRIVRAIYETEQTGWWILPSAVGTVWEEERDDGVQRRH